MRTTWRLSMKNQKLTFLLSLTFLFLFSGSSVVLGDDLQDGVDAYEIKDYETAYKLFLPLAEPRVDLDAFANKHGDHKGIAEAQSNLGVMYYKGEEVPQDYVLAYMWWSISSANGSKDAVTDGNSVEKKMSKQQIEKAQELARNWKPKK